MSKKTTPIELDSCSYTVYTNNPKKFKLGDVVEIDCTFPKEERLTFEVIEIWWVNVQKDYTSFGLRGNILKSVPVSLN